MLTYDEVTDRLIWPDSEGSIGCLDDIAFGVCWYGLIENDAVYPIHVMSEIGRARRGVFGDVRAFKNDCEYTKDQKHEEKSTIGDE